MKDSRYYNKKIVKWRLVNYEWSRQLHRLFPEEPDKTSRNIWVDINNILTKDTVIYYDLVIKEWLPRMTTRFQPTNTFWLYREIIEKKYNLFIDPNELYSYKY